MSTFSELPSTSFAALPEAAIQWTGLERRLTWMTFVPHVRVSRQSEDLAATTVVILLGDPPDVYVERTHVLLATSGVVADVGIFVDAHPMPIVIVPAHDTWHRGVPEHIHAAWHVATTLYDDPEQLTPAWSEASRVDVEVGYDTIGRPPLRYQTGRTTTRGVAPPSGMVQTIEGHMVVTES